MPIFLKVLGSRLSFPLLHLLTGQLRPFPQPVVFVPVTYTFISPASPPPKLQTASWVSPLWWPTGISNLVCPKLNSSSLSSNFLSQWMVQIYELSKSEAWTLLLSFVSFPKQLPFLLRGFEMCLRSVRFLALLLLLLWSWPLSCPASVSITASSLNFP